MKLVVDASVAMAAAATPVGFARFTGIDLVAPLLLSIEVVSSLHAAMWPGELRRDQAEPALRRALAAPIQRVAPSLLDVAVAAFPSRHRCQTLRRVCSEQPAAAFTQTEDPGE